LLSAGILAGLISIRSGRPYWWTIAAGLLLGLAGAIRFAYWPLACVIPAGLFVAGIFERQLRARLVLSAALSGLATASVFAVVAACQFHRLGSLTGEVRYRTGWHWNHLAHFRPFPADCLGFSSTWNYLATKAPHLASLVSETCIAWAVSIAVLALALAPLLSALNSVARRSQRADGDRDLLSYIVTAGVCTTGLTLLLLTYFSLRETYQHISGIWTYVLDKRYFSVFFAFLWVALIWTIWRLIAPGGSRWRRVIATAVAIARAPT
jgi:hypothetical protein